MFVMAAEVYTNCGEWLSPGYKSCAADFALHQYHSAKGEQMTTLRERQDPAGETGILKKIVGGRLTSVCFVMDYLTLGFDNKGSLTSLVWPDVVDSQGCTTSFGNESYKDDICDLITQIVTDVQMSKDEIISVTFENGCRLIIRLRDRKTRGERAIFTAPKHHLQVW
jgi:hypothetical protein